MSRATAPEAVAGVARWRLPGAVPASVGVAPSAVYQGEARAGAARPATAAPSVTLVGVSPPAAAGSVRAPLALAPAVGTPTQPADRPSSHPAASCRTPVPGP